MVEEVWKQIKDFEGYEVSNTGKVRSIDRIINCDNRWGGKRSFVQKGKEVKITKGAGGYYRVNLWNHSTYKTMLVHRLVAMAFVEGYEEGKIINHKDENKCNNNAENLEWCDYKYNNSYGTKPERHSNRVGRTIVQFDKLGNAIKIWKSSLEIQKILGFANSDINACANGKRSSAFGFKWSFI